jgi:predicted esterase
MVYVPKNSRKLYPHGAPAVYVFSGGSQPNRLFFDITRGWEIADEYGFIVVVPCSQYSGPPYTPLETRWNYTNGNLDEKADDFEFIKLLIPKVESQYNIDSGRRFAVGHSNGSMFCHGMGYRMPEYFTAMAGSGATSNPIDDSATSVLPFMLTYGENERRTYDLSVPGSNRDLVSYWLDRNLGDIADIDNPDTVTFGIGMLERLTLYTWTSEQDIPLYAYGVVAGRNHNVSVDTNWSVWEEWFSKWRKDDEGNLYYQTHRKPFARAHKGYKRGGRGKPF